MCVCSDEQRLVIDTTSLSPHKPAAAAEHELERTAKKRRLIASEDDGDTLTSQSAC